MQPGMKHVKRHKQCRRPFVGARPALLILLLAEAIHLAADPADPHLWLEDIEGERALTWVAEQNRESEARLTTDQRFAAIEEAAYAVYSAADRIPYAAQAGQRMLNFWQDEAHVRGLLRSAGLQDYLDGKPHWQVLLDIDQLAEVEGENWVYKGAECLEPDVSRCLLMLSRGGGDAVVVREFDLDAKRFVTDGFVSSEAKQSVAWLDADRLLIAKAGDGFRTTDSGYGAELRLWRRGEPLQASELVLEVPADHVAVSGAVLVNALGTFPFAVDSPSFFQEDVYFLGDVPNGDADPEREDHEAGQDKRRLSPKKLPLPQDVDWRGLFLDHLIGLTRSEWHPSAASSAQPDGASIPAGALFSVPLRDLLAGQLAGLEALVRPTDRRAITGVRAGHSSLYVSLTEDVVMQLLTLRPHEGGWERQIVSLPENGSLGIVSANPFSNLALVNFESFLSPDTLYAIRPGKAPNPVARLPARFDAAEFSARQTFATSSDGVKVPCFIIEPKGRGGPRPTLLYGYGGFEIALTPSYLSPLASAWLQAGGVFAIANIRGGGEYGPEWHQAALGPNRQRAYDDFAAVAEHLAASGVTRPQQLGIYGGSNGGLLVGVAFTQRPDLYGAAVSAVPLLDMLRYDKLLAGASWTGEYGDPDDAEAREWLTAYSPYQNVHPDAAYPPVFLTTSTKDDRVHPGHARKMAARLKSQGHDVLYYENTEGGHSAAANLAQLARRDALVATFLMQELMKAAKSAD